MEGLRPTAPDVATEYQPMRSCDSDDSQSNASRSEDNEAVPGIIYTSDDSADVMISDSTYVDSDIPNYIAQNVNHKMEDELSQQFLLESEVMSSSPQPSSNVDDPFVTHHPLSPVKLNMNGTKEMCQAKNAMYSDRPIVHLQVNPGDSLGLTRSNSTSSSSTEVEFPSCPPFLSHYEPLTLYNEDHPYTGGLHFEGLNEDPVKSKVIHDQLNTLNTVKEIKKKHKNHTPRYYVGNVPIDARYRDAFFVKWNWPRIRQSCVFINLSFLVGFLCVGIGLVVKMPKGTDCNPAQEWWQGSVTYHVFVPSFQDTDGDGMGDLNGVITRLDYLQELGIKTVRLAPIFDPPTLTTKGASSPTNYTQVSPLLGDNRDLHLLAALLHERDMFIVLDIPLANVDEDVVSPTINLIEEVPTVLSHWLSLGVDGFAFPELALLANSPGLILALHGWRNMVDARGRGGIHRRVLMVPVTLLKHLESTSSVDLQVVLTLVDLIEVQLDLTVPAEMVAVSIDDATRWDDHKSLPWISWRTGGPFEPRVGDMGREFNVPGQVPGIGYTMVQLFLPGSVTLYYGDEIGLTQAKGKQNMSWATPMAWSPQEGPGAGFTKGDKAPWMDLGQKWEERNVDSLNKSLAMAPIRVMIEATQKEVPLYINGIFEDVGSFHPVKSSNYKIRYASGSLFILDRSYPRRNKYAIVANLGPDPIERDLSKLYYGGRVLASSHGKKGYVTFKNIQLMPRETLAMVLDK